MKFSKKALKRGLVLLLVLALLLSFSAANLLAAPGFLSSGGPANPSGKVDVLVGFHGPPDREVVVRAGGEIYAEFTIVNVIAASMAPGAADALARNPRVSYVEPDAPVYAVETATASSTQTVPWGIDRVFGPEEYSFLTWESAKGSGIGVAVLDTGIDKSHSDLTVMPEGTNTVDDTDYHVDENSHGTHVAGTIAALDNEFGVVGVAPKVDLYAVKVLNASGSGTMSTVTKGVEWAAAQEGIKVINMSLSGGYSETLQDACQVAYNNGHLLVAAAGNSGNPGGGGDNVGYPAAYDSVIAVAASDSNDNRARFSSTGSAVELIAPGVSILSTVPGDSYGTKSGTSMASPHVAGVAALVWSAMPNLNNEQLRLTLRETAEDLGLVATQQGYGLVRADLAVASVVGEADPTVEYQLTISVVGEGSTEPAVGTHTYSEGTEVELNASPDEGWEFEKWDIDGAEISEPNTTITMDGYKVATAYFKESEVVQPPDDPAELNLVVATDRSEYTWNSWVYITVTVKDESDTVVPGAGVSVTVSYPDGSTAATYFGTTDASGGFTTRYRVMNRAPVGEYWVDAVAALGEIEGTDAATFTVKQR